MEDHRTPRRLRDGPLTGGRRARRAHRGGAAHQPPARTGARVNPPGPRLAARHAPRPAHPRPHRPDPRPRPGPRPRPHHRPPRPPPAPPPRHHPRPRPPTMTVPRSPDAARASSPAGLPPSSRTDRSSAHTLPGALRGTCWPSPERHSVRFTIASLARGHPGVAQIVDADVTSLALRSLQSTLRRNRTCGRDPDRRSRPRKGDRRCVCRAETDTTSRTSDRAMDDTGGPSSDDRQH